MRGMWYVTHSKKLWGKHVLKMATDHAIHTFSDCWEEHLISACCWSFVRFCEWSSCLIDQDGRYAILHSTRCHWSTCSRFWCFFGYIWFEVHIHQTNSKSFKKDHWCCFSVTGFGWIIGSFWFTCGLDLIRYTDYWGWYFFPICFLGYSTQTLNTLLNVLVV